jgi:predicted O-methyltransferase YrrM
MDLVLIDANHTYPFVRQDTESAFRLVRRGGAIIWDDYIWSPEHPECEGVTRCLNELACSRPIFQIRGTRLAIYREGVASAARDRL